MSSADGTDGADANAIMTTGAAAADGTTTFNGSFASAAIGSVSGGVYTMVEAQKIAIDSATADESTRTFTITGTNRDGSTISESIVGATSGGVSKTINFFKSVSSVTVITTSSGAASATVGNIQIGVAGTSDTLTYKGAREFGDFDIATSAAATVTAETSSTTTGDIDLKDLELAATLGNDTATVQGTLSLKSSKLFSVTQSGVEDTANDNYFTTQAATLNTVSNIDLRTQSSASLAIATLDGAIQKISSIRSDLGAIENRLDHTVSNLMNIAEQTEAARSRIQDADFAAESAKLSKAQVLKQAGVGMLAQANAGAQLVLQLLQ